MPIKPLSPSSSRLRVVWGLLLLIGLTCLGGCPLNPSSPEEAEAKDKVPPRPLEVGEVVDFTFSSKATQWVASPYVAAYDHDLIIRPTGAARGLQPIAMRFKIRNMEFVLDGKQSFVVIQPGRIFFKVDPRLATGFKGSVDVEIERLR